MLQTKHLYRVYFYYPVTGRSFEAGETFAVSQKDAINHVRWNVFGRLSMETLMVDKGISFVAARAGSDKDKRLTDLDPTNRKRPRSTKRRDRQTYFSGPGFTTKPDSRRH